MPIRVALAFSNMLFSEGVKRILDVDDEFETIDVLGVGPDETSKLYSSEPDVILVDFITLYNTFTEEDLSKAGKFILLDTCCGEDNIMSAILTKKISGVLLSHATPALLRKAIVAVASGEVWLDKATVRNVITGLNVLKKKRKPNLSEREENVVELVALGLKNKEIAQKLHISEPTVKSHLHRIFQKLDINNRSQLITFAIKNDIIGETQYTINQKL